MRDKNGKATGVLRSEAYFYAKAKIASIYPLEIKNRAVNEAAKTCICHGVTAVHALEGGRIFGDEGVMPILKKMDRLPLDLTLFLQEKNLVYATKLGFRHLGGCILIDGSIGSYTAALDQDYQDAKGVRGHIYEKQREFFAFVEGAHDAGVQLSFHAIGRRERSNLFWMPMRVPCESIRAMTTDTGSSILNWPPMSRSIALET